jgi:GDP-L-fucose synthase
MTEDQLLTGILEPTNEPYAIAKIAAIKLCRYFNEQYGTDYLSVMPTNLYGPNDNFDLLNSHVLPAMLRKIYLAGLLQDGDLETVRKNLAFHEPDKAFEKADEKTILDYLAKFNVTPGIVGIWGTGKPFREFLHVDDMASACVYLMDNYSASQIGEFVNIGTGMDISIAGLANLICGITGFRGKLNYDTTKPDGTPKKLQDITRLNSLGWKASISLEDGIRQTFEWYRELFLNK